MDKFELNSQFGGSTTKARSKIDHIWANVPRNECKLDATKVYLIFTNQFILYSNYITHSQCITKGPLIFPFIQNIIYVTTCVNTWCISQLVTPKQFHHLLFPNVASFIACDAWNQIIYLFFKDHMHKTSLYGS